MDAQDRLTAEEALSSHDVTVFKAIPDSQASSSTTTGIKDTGQLAEPSNSNRNAESTSDKLEQDVKHTDNMTETLTYPTSHLSLAAANKEYSVELSQRLRNEIFIRSPANITLSVNIRVVHGKALISSSVVDLPANKCSLLSDLRAQVVIATSNGAKLQNGPLWEDSDLKCQVCNLQKVAFRLEEDGHIATMTIAPTQICALTVFPHLNYETWYYRNVLRGNQNVYKVEVTIQI